MSEFYVSDEETDYEIRTLDYGDYRKGFLQLLEQLTIVDTKLIGELDFVNRVQDLKDAHGHLVYVMIDNNIDKIVATGTIFIEKKFIHKMGYVGHIEDVVVDQNYRNKGLGKEIINTLVEFARSIECYKVILDCSKENVGFYENCDFEKKGIEMAKYF
jgi:glucosamine-phosphate N-acetyltransferase